MAIQRMTMMGANPMTWMAVNGEWQRDWVRRDRSNPIIAQLLLVERTYTSRAHMLIRHRWAGAGHTLV
ncbi:hypothetical protein [Roseomonas sp. WA12]